MKKSFHLNQKENQFNNGEISPSNERIRLWAINQSKVLS